MASLNPNQPDTDQHVEVEETPADERTTVLGPEFVQAYADAAGRHADNASANGDEVTRVMKVTPHPDDIASAEADADAPQQAEAEQAAAAEQPPVDAEQATALVQPPSPAEAAAYEQAMNEYAPAPDERTSVIQPPAMDDQATTLVPPPPPPPGAWGDQATTLVPPQNWGGEQQNWANEQATTVVPPADQEQATSLVPPIDPQTAVSYGYAPPAVDPNVSQHEGFNPYVPATLRTGDPVAAPLQQPYAPQQAWEQTGSQVAPDGAQQVSAAPYGTEQPAPGYQVSGQPHVQVSGPPHGQVSGPPQEQYLPEPQPASAPGWPVSMPNQVQPQQAPADFAAPAAYQQAPPPPPPQQQQYPQANQQADPALLPGLLPPGAIEVAVPAIGPDAPAAPSAEEFAKRREHKPSEPEATMGMPAVMRRLSFGLISPKMSKKEKEHRKAVELVRRNFGGLRQVTVVNPKGGAGKTVAVLMTSMTFGQNRGGYVLAWDNNETQGTLGMRAQPDFHSHTVRDVLSALEHFRGSGGKVGDLTQFVRSQGGAMFDVLASDESATAGEMLTADAFASIREIVDRFYKLMVVDTGNNVRAENWQAAIDATNQLVVTMSARGDSAETAARMLDHLEQTGRGELARRAVTVISMPATRKGLDLPAIERHFAARTRAVLVAPYEPLLDSGEPIRYEGISRDSRDAWLKITAAVAEGL